MTGASAFMVIAFVISELEVNPGKIPIARKVAFVSTVIGPV
jgi:hypothetical protein